MPKKYANRAIIVLESPWELDSADANRSSVLPFIEGVAKLEGDTDVLHANFYDESSLLFAAKCLAKSRHRNALVYIAAHGGDGMVGEVELLSVFAAIQLFAKQCNITGVLIGSCHGAECVTKLQTGIGASQLRWCASYASGASWLQGTLIDCAILQSMLDLPAAAYKSGDKIIKRLAEAVSLFSPAYPIGTDDDGVPVALGDSLKFVIQPEGQGHRARDVSADVFDLHARFQLDDSDDEN